MTDNVKARAARALVAALTEAGFTEAGRSRGVVRFGWTNGSLLVPTDPDAPEFDDLWLGVLRELERIMHLGTVAGQVLARVGGVGCPRCGRLAPFDTHGVCGVCAAQLGWDPECLACQEEQAVGVSGKDHVDGCVNV